MTGIGAHLPQYRHHTHRPVIQVPCCFTEIFQTRGRMKLLFARMMRVIRLDWTLFEEIISDPKTQGHSYWVVAILAMATGYGMFSRAGGTAVNIGLAVTFFSWYVWAFTVYYAGTRMFRAEPSRIDRKTVLRVLAFACAPGVLRIFGVIPNMTLIIFLVTSAWIIFAGTNGIKLIFKLERMGTALMLCAATWLVVLFLQILFMILLFSVFGVS
jgi:hypothetical protein